MSLTSGFTFIPMKKVLVDEVIRMKKIDGGCSI